MDDAKALIMEQQYTCPFCYQDYTRFTISEHYGCGVEPLETTEDIEQELAEISEEVAVQKAVETYGQPTETEPTIEIAQPPEQTVKPEPKKRGRKPKAK